MNVSKFLILVLSLALFASCKEQEDQSSFTHNPEPTQEELDCKNSGEEIVYHTQLHLDGVWNKLAPTLTWNIWRITPDGVGAPLTQYSSGQYSRFPRGSASGKYVVYISTVALDGKDSSAGGVPNVWVSTRDGKRQWPVTKNTLPTLPTYWGVISPDDKYVVFHSNLNLSGKWDEPPNPVFNIWVIDREGKLLPRAITQNKIVGSDSFVSAISPEGKWILGRSSMNLAGTLDAAPVLSPNMWMFSFDGSQKLPLTKNTKISLNSSGGHFFPDGSRVAFISVMSLTGVFDAPKNPAWTIWSVKTDGTDLKLVAGSAVHGYYFSAISKDGKTIYASSNRSLDGTNTLVSSANLWAVNSDGSGMVPLTLNKNANLSSYSPRLSPSGDYLVYISQGDITGTWDGASATSYNIWRMKADGTQRVPLTFSSHALLDTNIDMPPDWLPSVKCQ